MELSISEQLTYSTIRIEAVNIQKGTTSTGTGYFFKFLENKEANTHVPVIITNKHVIENAQHGRLIFVTSDKDGNPLDQTHHIIEINNFESMWILHPDDNVDLCVMPIASIINNVVAKGINLFYISLDKSLIPTASQINDFSALEEVIMIGYPNGIWDSVNNKPIVRKGVTATHPSKDYNGKKEFLIDMACFPGSSGSPIFIFNEGGYQDKKGNMFLGQNRIIFLGTLYAGPQHKVTGEIEIIPIANKPIAVSHIPNNLGLVIKHDRILELEQLLKV